ncbi:Fic family protein [Marinobacterium sp. D7]|uniref:Fic family protein n=1 Tax=Marinobacterium ramblicola TaxID=2849041 RepID=UPI001C2DA0F4|nr:Fic family protein [Marinobacterium ramblicola]MBV1787510.1 Fic family protein [Marinobacterium ramblicola]
MPKFTHYDLSLLNPSFDSPLVDVLTELEHLRRLQLQGTTPPLVFFQLKEIFHILESLGSARIEGNHTTLADYVESRLEGETQAADQLREMVNIERAMAYVEETVEPGSAISQHWLRELHALTVQDLEREGDDTPGQFRQGSVAIAKSEHLPPEAVQVPGYMEELIAFINEEHPHKYDLIKVALAHHRFGWIHPFGNGNGRVVRLLTYALLIKYGFNVQTGGRVLNPTAVFCNDRERYYAMLGEADKGSDQGLEVWCIYVLQGMLDELRKVDQLTDFGYLQEKILIPALEHARERELITPQEQKILLIAAKTGVVKAAHLKEAMKGLKSSQQTYQIKKLVDAGMLRPVKEGSRQYTFGFSHNYLIRGVIRALTEQGFIPASLNEPT